MKRIPFAVFAGTIAYLLVGAMPLAVAAEAKPAPKSSTPPAAKAAGMTNAKLEALIRRIDKNAQGRPGFWEFNVEGRVVAVVTDEKANRMRIISAVGKMEDVQAELLQRLMQANFDSALDARYSIAKGVVWSAFIHPLGSLNDEEFLSGLGQVINLGLTYGTSFSSGALIYNGGDSAANLQRRELIDRLLKKGLAI